MCQSFVSRSGKRGINFLYPIAAYGRNLNNPRKSCQENKIFIDDCIERYMPDLDQESMLGRGEAKNCRNVSFFLTLSTA